MFTHKHRDLISSSVLIGVGLIFCIGSVRYGDVRARIPSAGFFPFVGGMILIFLSVIHLISFVRKKATGEKEKFFPQRYSWKRILFSLFTLFAYGVSLKFLGFFLVTFLFMLFSLRFIEPLKWKMVFALSILTSVFSYLLFEVWLKVQLPHGIFEGMAKWIF